MSKPYPASLLAGLMAAALISAPLAASAQSRAPEGETPTATPQVKPPTPPAGTDINADPSRRAECAWTGQRIVTLLWRDDVNTAREQTRFYELFGCPSEHLPLAFRCVIEQSESQPDQNDITARVYSCWMTPQAAAPKE